jgi:hypothetical protein
MYCFSSVRYVPLFSLDASSPYQSYECNEQSATLGGELGVALDAVPEDALDEKLLAFRNLLRGTGRALGEVLEAAIARLAHGLVRSPSLREVVEIGVPGEGMTRNSSRWGTGRRAPPSTAGERTGAV